MDNVGKSERAQKTVIRKASIWGSSGSKARYGHGANAPCGLGCAFAVAHPATLSAFAPLAACTAMPAREQKKGSREKKG